MYDRLDKNFFSIVQKYEYDVKVSRIRTFVRGQRRTKVRLCGRTLSPEKGRKKKRIRTKKKKRIRTKKKEFGKKLL